MFTARLLSILLLVIAVKSQQVGNLKPEVNPPLSWQLCTTSTSCETVLGGVTLDANSRWLHSKTGFTNCFTGSAWVASLCPDGLTCAVNCALDGADYNTTYGITSSEDSLTLKLVTGLNVGSRVFLLNPNDTYATFDLRGNEFSFDVDVSQLPCGVNGALYFTEMDDDGGMSRFPTNQAGAKYGTGYCDSQCPRDIKFINGAANIQNFLPSTGTGQFGSCCNQMDVWQANAISNTFAAHPCTIHGPNRCSGKTCGDTGDLTGALCDADGCGYNSFQLGDKSFYGPLGTGINTNSKFTVITQFIPGNSDVSEIRRLYVQNGQLIGNSKTNVPGMATFDSITPAFCDAEKEVFNENATFQDKGGLSQMFTRPMVLVFRIWDDNPTNMLWLDSNFPADRAASAPGVARGTCPASSGSPAGVETSASGSQVVFSNIKFGPIGSTFIVV